MADNKNLVFVIILTVAGFFLFQKFALPFSVQDFEAQFGDKGPLLEITKDNPLFDSSMIVGGRVSFSVPSCFTEDTIPPTTTVSINNKVIASSGPSTTCESLISQGEEGDPTEQDIVTGLFEIDPSLLQPTINLRGADSIIYFMRVECNSNNDCIDPIRQTTFLCDMVDYTCKLPDDVSINISTMPSKDSDLSSLAIPILVLIAAIVGGFFLFGGRKN